MNSDEEDDLLFNRNRAGWKKVRLAPEEPQVVDVSSDDSAGEPARARKKRKVTGGKGKLPDWTRGFDNVSDDSESKPRKTPSKRKGKGTADKAPESPSVKRDRKGKGTQKKTLPRELTPPPELDPAQLEAALTVVSYALFPDQQSSFIAQEGVIDLDDGDGDEDGGSEDLELAKILEESRAAAAKKVEQERLLRTGSHQADEESEIKIKIRVFWEPPPGAHAKWAFAFSYTAPFRRLFETITQKVEGVRMEDIVLLYEGKRLYAGGSPKAARMRTDKTSEIRACHVSTWMSKDAGRMTSRRVTSHNAGGEYVPGVPAPESASRGASVAPEDDDADVIKLYLRCRARPEPLRLNVRTTAKCGKVIDAYLRKLVKEGIVPQNREGVRIELDGEGVDDNATVEGLEIEDGDQLDVGGV